MTAPFVRRESSPFLKRVLIPFWILRVLILLIGIAFYALTLAALIVFEDDILNHNDIRKLESEYDTKLALGTLKAVTGVIMGIQLICLILELTCIVKRCRRTLSPGFFLGTNVVQSTFVIVNFALSMVGARTPGTIGISVAILVLFLVFLIYAAVVYHKYRKGELDGGAEAGMVKGSQ
ncbi:hypothetical protein B0T14DRAFT_440594 [Immersiella caudata]|uniref:Uncharacterized protein n=1 Tax=Immersiella caudata TaxID=314043 RepID=A0AA39U6J4_9PEZI|nr:hypothetical protein B0T14DRAFT_440594 [Immersiella caudata]